MVRSKAHAGVDVIYMDFKKAFDSVSHNALLSKLQGFGITGNLQNWLTTYLKTRTQCVHIGDTHSNHCAVLSGVPQGSILGPLLFSIFINDLPSSFKHSIPILFADDTKSLKAIHSTKDIEDLQADLDSVSFCSNFLTKINLCISIIGQPAQTLLQLTLLMVGQLITKHNTKILTFFLPAIYLGLNITNL